MGIGLKMGKIEGYVIIGKNNGVKHYFLSSIKMWTSDFKKISLRDVNESKIEINIEDYPMMDKEYSHEKITFNGNFFD